MARRVRHGFGRRRQHEPGRRGAVGSLHRRPAQLLRTVPRLTRRDYFTPFDVALFLEGVNDLNANIAPGIVTAGMKSMVVDAKAKGAQVVLELFQSYGKDIFGNESTDPAKVADYNKRLEALAAEQQVFRERYAGISMGPDGLHPSQAGYDVMAAIAYDKLRDIFRRCGTTGVCP